MVHRGLNSDILAFHPKVIHKPPLEIPPAEQHDLSNVDIGLGDALTGSSDEHSE